MLQVTARVAPPQRHKKEALAVVGVRARDGISQGQGRRRACLLFDERLARSGAGQRVCLLYLGGQGIAAASVVSSDCMRAPTKRTRYRFYVMEAPFDLLHSSQSS